MNFLPKNHNYLDAIKEDMKKQNFMKYIGFKLTKITPGYMEGEIPFEDFLRQHKSLLHGGVIATISDLACGFAAHTLVSENEYVVTSDLKIAYLNPGVGKKFLAKGWVIKAGSRMFFCEAEISDAHSGILIAKSSATMVIIPELNI